MLFVQEIHDVVAGRMEEFGAAMRDVWRPQLEADGTARLLWCWELTHGTGPSYQAITFTAVRDWPAWGGLVEKRRTHGPWRDVDAHLWTLRREVTATTLVPASWSPLQSIDLAAPPPPAPDAPALHLHDTGWPFPGGLDAYVEALGRIYLPQVRQSKMIALEGCLTVAPGTGRHHEVVLLQRILDWPRFAELLSRGEQGAQRAGWMVEGLTYRDRWLSRLLRVAPWSPWR
jgi:hypothetical protein